MIRFAECVYAYVWFHDMVCYNRNVPIAIMKPRRRRIYGRLCLRFRGLKLKINLDFYCIHIGVKENMCIFLLMYIL